MACVCVVARTAVALQAVAAAVCRSWCVACWRMRLPKGMLAAPVHWCGGGSARLRRGCRAAVCIAAVAAAAVAVAPALCGSLGPDVPGCMPLMHVI